MTLIQAMVNRDQAVLLSDRRLSSNGRLVEDDSNKAGVIVLRDARLAVAYTGLARAPGFETSRWLWNSLSELAAPDHLMEPLIVRFAERAGRDFASLPGSLDKRLTVVFVGYSYSFDPPRPYLWRVSNFQGGPFDEPAAEASDEFTSPWWRGNDPPPECVCLMQSFGYTNVITPEQFSELHDLLHARKPADALIGKGLEILHEAADSPMSAGTIGKRATSLVLPSDAQFGADALFHPDKATHSIGGVTYIEARGGPHGVYLIESGHFDTYNSDGSPMITTVPKVRRRQPCPCGSGKRYKNCHEGKAHGEIIIGEGLRLRP